MINMLKKIFNIPSGINYRELKERGALILDVRTNEEYCTGHLKDAVNVPLDNIGMQIPLIRKMKKPVIAVCRSGNRSNLAVNILRNSGIEAYNGGSWNSLKSKL